MVLLPGGIKLHPHWKREHIPRDGPLGSESILAAGGGRIPAGNPHFGGKVIGRTQGCALSWSTGIWEVWAYVPAD